MKERSRYHCCRRKAINITYSQCVSVALIIKHAKLLGLIVLSSVTCPTLKHFPTLHNYRKEFRGGGGVTEHAMCVFIFSKTFVSNISHSQKN
jgi:hypothetical protein